MSQGKPSLMQRILGWLGFGNSQPTTTNKTTSRKTASSKPKQGAREKLPVTTPKLFIGNLSYSVDEKQLRDLFKSAGKVEKAEIVKHRKTNRSKGFAFVTMGSVADAEAAAEQLDGEEIDGRTIGVSGAKAENRRPASSKKTASKKASSDRPNERGPKGGQRDSGIQSDNRSNNRGPKGRGGKGRGRGQGKGRAAESTVVAMAVPEVMSSNLIISNIDESFSESELEALFEGVATISESKIEDGKVSVEMKSIDAAQEAVRVLDGKDFMGKTLSISEA